jgi:ubiquinone/menaquinone biosynthesis C-methylase UbiE/uncharacterized protein YbaR (Trm112 family)
MTAPPGASLQLDELVCPACRLSLRAAAEALHCNSCGRTFPVLLGIPDLRLEPDPWISIVDDRNKGERLEKEHPGAGVDALVNAYWDMTPGTPAYQKARFTQYVREGEARSAEFLALDVSVAPALGQHWLDLGCGTGDFSVAAARSGATVTGLDVAFRWLVVARRRASSAQIGVRYVCGNAERLPFPDASFSRVVALGLLEHCHRPWDVLAEVQRVLRPGGDVVIRTVNRYSLLPEPHVHVWGVGYLPRRWADRYVRMRSGQRYQHHRPLSASELGQLMNRAGFRDVHVGAARLLESDRTRLPGPLTSVTGLYEAGRRLPMLAQMLRVVAPLLEARGIAR